MLWSLLLAIGLASPPTNDPERRAALTSLYDHWPLPAVPAIDAEAVRIHLAAQDAVLVDVRPEDERQVSTLPGALSLDAIQAHPDAFKDKLLIAYCTVGVRSAYATEQLRGQGLNAVNFRGSILAWTHIGGPLVDPKGQPTAQVHVYGPTWNYAAAAYQPMITGKDGLHQPLSTPSAP